MAVLLVAFCLTANPAWAAAGVGDPPVYNPVTKSYFQLLKGTGRHGNWREAREQAHGTSFRGVRGRLAVIDKAETHEFIMENFDTSNVMWIGLRYWCQLRMLQWSGQRPYSPSDPDRFQIWHVPWSRNNQLCPPNARGDLASMGVYYQPMGTKRARWQAVRKGKGFGHLLVEFPTGEK